MKQFEYFKSDLRALIVAFDSKFHFYFDLSYGYEVAVSSKMVLSHHIATVIYSVAKVSDNLVFLKRTAKLVLFDCDNYSKIDMKEPAVSEVE